MGTWKAAQENEAAWWERFINEEMRVPSRDYLVGSRGWEGRIALAQIGFPWRDQRYSEKGSIMRGRWLDVGSGPVSFFESDHAEPVVLAIDPNMAEYARRLPDICRLETMHNTTYQSASVHEIEGQFDVVWCFNVLDHADDWQRIIAKMAALLAPDGWLGIGVDCRNGWTDRLHISAITPDMLNVALESNGLRIVYELAEDSDKPFFRLNVRCEHAGCR